MSRQPFYLVGPTASGKSAVAIELALRMDGDIVNADAFQLYRGLDICTAKPTPADLARVRHHLYGVIPASEFCDARRFVELARPVIDQILARNRTPIVVGGGGLYVKSLTHGLDELPSDGRLRDKLSHLTNNERVAWLLSRDPRARETVDLKNDRRVTRALEICLLARRPQSELRDAWLKNPANHRGARLEMAREELNARIADRVLRMVDAGLVEEIRSLSALSLTAEKAIGIREVRAFLAGQTTLSDAVTAIQIATRQYARRQEKWFKRETGLTPVSISGSQSPAEVADAILAAVPGLTDAV